ncbi:MAG: hypothetical protein WCD30_09700 [Pseudolabrys sp.]
MKLPPDCHRTIVRLFLLLPGTPMSLQSVPRRIEHTDLAKLRGRLTDQYTFNEKLFYRELYAVAWLLGFGVKGCTKRPTDHTIFTEPDCYEPLPSQSECPLSGGKADINRKAKRLCFTGVEKPHQ